MRQVIHGKTNKGLYMSEVSWLNVMRFRDLRFQSPMRREKRIKGIVPKLKKQ